MAYTGHAQTLVPTVKLANPRQRQTPRRLGYMGLASLGTLVVLLALLWFLGAGSSLVMAAPTAVTYYVTDTGTNANACTSIDPCSLARAASLAVSCLLYTSPSPRD